MEKTSGRVGRTTIRAAFREEGFAAAHAAGEGLSQEAVLADALAVQTGDVVP